MFALYQRSFVNACLANFLGLLESLPTLDSWAALREGLINGHFGALGISGRDADYFLREEPLLQVSYVISQLCTPPVRLWKQGSFAQSCGWALKRLLYEVKTVWHVKALVWRLRSDGVAGTVALLKSKRQSAAMRTMARA